MADNKKKFTLQAYDIENEEIGKGNILRTKNVEIETIDDVRISEPALIQEMEEFLRELNSEL